MFRLACLRTQQRLHATRLTKIFARTAQMTAEKRAEDPWADREVASWKSDREFTIGDTRFVTRPTDHVSFPSTNTATSLTVRSTPSGFRKHWLLSSK